VVTERDMVGALAQGANPHDHVTTVDTIRPYWVPASMSVPEAAGLMVGLGVRHLVVVNQSGMPVGVVSMAELLVSLLRAPNAQTVFARFSEVLLGHEYFRTVHGSDIGAVVTEGR
jgi:signal-transduction protein with cAMP-binding, CBS, and nucleotidyltransferase domain